MIRSSDIPMTGGLKAFKESEQGRAMFAEVEDAYQEARARVKGEFVRGRVASGEEQDRAEQSYDSAERGELADDWVVMFSRGQWAATIADIRRDPEHYDGMDCCDPLEPNYRNWANVAQIRFHHDMVRIVTQAHSGPWWLVTRPYVADDAAALAYTSGSASAETLMPPVAAPADPLKRLEDIVHIPELVARLAPMPDVEWLGRAEAFCAGLGISKAELKKLVKEARATTRVDVPPTSGGRPLIDENTPSDTALLFMSMVEPHLVFSQEEILRWDGAAWLKRDRAMLAHEVHKFLAGADTETPHPFTGAMVRTRFNPKTAHVLEVLGAIERLQAIDLPFPSWKDGRPCGNVISFRNAWLDPVTLSSGSPTPDLLTRCALDFAYDPHAPSPEFFFETTHQWWPDQQLWEEMTDQLQKYIGWLLTQTTSYQKIALLMGPPRSGKSEAARFLSKIVGGANVAACSSRALAKNEFVYEGFRGKSLVLFPDMRVKSDVAEDVLEKLLNISGEDIVGINRKGKSYLYEKLSCRLVIVCNLFPDFHDVTGALSRRLLPFRFGENFEGREDRDIEAKLEADLPGVILWGLDGLRKLQAMGGFTLGPVAKAIVSTLYHQGAPLADFVDAYLDVVPGGRVAKADLYRIYSAWAKFNGEEHPLQPAYFSTKLRATVATIGDTRPRDAQGKQVPTYTGICLKP